MTRGKCLPKFDLAWIDSFKESLAGPIVWWEKQAALVAAKLNGLAGLREKLKID